MQCVSRNIYLKLLKSKKCLRKKYIFTHPNFFEVDKFSIDFVERNNKKFDLYLVSCEFKLELNNNINPQIKREYFYNTSIISMKKYLLYSIEHFMSRGYIICKIKEMIIQTISDRRNMTYKYYLNQPMSMCERVINMIFAKKPQLINVLDGKKTIF